MIRFSAFKAQRPRSVLASTKSHTYRWLVAFRVSFFFGKTISPFMAIKLLIADALDRFLLLLWNELRVEEASKSKVVKTIDIFITKLVYQATEQWRVISTKAIKNLSRNPMGNLHWWFVYRGDILTRTLYQHVWYPTHRITTRQNTTFQLLSM